LDSSIEIMVEGLKANKSLRKLCFESIIHDNKQLLIYYSFKACLRDKEKMKEISSYLSHEGIALEELVFSFLLRLFIP